MSQWNAVNPITNGQCQAQRSEDGKQCVKNSKHTGEHSVDFGEPLSTGPEPPKSPNFVTAQTTLTSSEALVTLTALRRYCAWLESDETRAWPRIRLTTWHADVLKAIERIEKAGHDVG